MSLTVLNASDLGALLTRFDNTALINRGAFHVLAFDAIRDRSGRRWPTRRELVREFIERHFQKYFSPTDQLAPLDDVNFLLVQPLNSGFDAQSRALKLLGEVLQFFLGVRAMSDVKLSQVTRIVSDRIEITPIEVSDADLIRTASMDWGAEPSRTSDPDASNSGPSSISCGPLTSVVVTGRSNRSYAWKTNPTYELVFVVEPLWGIRQKVVVSYLLRPLIFEREADRFVDAELANVSLRDLVRQSLIILTEAERILQEQTADNHFALYAPIHQATLSAASGRLAVLSALGRFQTLASASMIVLLTGLEIGTPHSRIVELTSMLAHQCRAVVALAPDLDCEIGHWRDAHLSGVAVDLSVLAKESVQLKPKQMSRFASRSQGIAPALIACSAPNSAAVLAAWSAGFTHVGGDRIFRHRNADLRPLRFDPIDLYRAVV